LTDEDKDKLGKTAAKMAVLVKSPERIRAICSDIAQHFQEKVAPNGFGAQVVTFDRESCSLYKQELDKHFGRRNLPKRFQKTNFIHGGLPVGASRRKLRNCERQDSAIRKTISQLSTISGTLPRFIIHALRPHFTTKPLDRS
jgi:hypothetical protein